jgi:hypothetical protein
MAEYFDVAHETVPAPKKVKAQGYSSAYSPAMYERVWPLPPRMTAREKDVLYRSPKSKEIDPLNPPWLASYSGSVCTFCGSASMVRTGICETCQNCGTTSGCA